MSRVLRMASAAALVVSAAGCQLIAGIHDRSVGSVDGGDASAGGGAGGASGAGTGGASSGGATSSGGSSGASPGGGGGVPVSAGGNGAGGARPDSGVSDGGVPPGTGGADAGPHCMATELECNGSCVPNDVKNCGTCGHDCTGLANVKGAVECNAGACVVPASSCAPGYAHCTADVEDGCETDVTTAQHCGACTVSCTDPTPLCAGTNGAYACASDCPASAPTKCGSTCVDTKTSPTHCGNCTTNCPGQAFGQATCAASKCGIDCNANYHDCGSGTCVSVSALDACGATCAKCTAGMNAMATCDGTKCGYQCNSGYHACSNACVSNSAVTSCGSSCTACPVPANGFATCNGTSCGFDCDTDYIKYGSQCIYQAIYISPGGSDTSTMGPFKTFDKAATIAVPGQIIYCKTGNYTAADFTKPLPDGVTLDREGFSGACTFTMSNSPTFNFAGSGTVQNVILKGFYSPLTTKSGTVQINNVQFFVQQAAMVAGGTSKVTITGGAINADFPNSGMMGVDATDTATLTINGTPIAGDAGGCASTNLGPAVQGDGASTVTISGVTLSQTFARALVYNGSGTFTVQNSQVNNSCGVGAMVMTGMKAGGKVVLTNNVFFDLVIGGGLGRLTARGNQFSGPIGVNILAATGAGAYDLGTAASAGGNFFSDPSQTVGIEIDAVGAALDASGNTWAGNTQGSDAQGHYTAGTIISGAVSGRNVSAAAGSSVKF